MFSSLEDDYIYIYITVPYSASNIQVYDYLMISSKNEGQLSLIEMSVLWVTS